MHKFHPLKPLTANRFLPIVPPLNAPVAQLDRVPGYEPGGRTFESCQARHTNKKAHLQVGFFVCGVRLAERRAPTFDKLRRKEQFGPSRRRVPKGAEQPQGCSGSIVPPEPDASPQQLSNAVAWDRTVIVPGAPSIRKRPPIWVDGQVSTSNKSRCPTFWLL